MKMLALLLALFLSVSGTAISTEYFPMHEGDVWYLSSIPEKYVGGVEELNGHIYHRLYSLPDTYSLYRADNAGNVFVADVNGEESVLYKFQPETDEVWLYNRDGIHYEVTLWTTDETIETAAGTFENCYGFWFRATNAADADFIDWFAPEVGLVKHSSLGWDRYRQLQKAKVGEKNYPDQEIPILVTSSLPLPNQRDIQPDMAIRIDLNFALPPEMITPGIIHVNSLTEGEVTGTVSQRWGSSQATLNFNPDFPFPYNDVVMVSLASDICDYRGDMLADEFSWSFTVRSQSYDSPPFTLISAIEDITIIPEAFALGDFDNDGDSDLVVSGHENNIPAIQLFANNGGVFSDRNSPLIALRPWSFRDIMHWIDYNNDGWTDLVYGGMDNDFELKICFYKNNKGAFELDESQNVKNFYNMSMQWCDYDRDSYPDLVLGGTDWDQHAIVLYHNDEGIMRESDWIYHPLDRSKLSDNPPEFKWIGAGATSSARLIVFRDEVITYSVDNGKLLEDGTFNQEDFTPVTADFDLRSISDNEWNEFSIGSTIFVTCRDELVFKGNMGETIDSAAVTLSDFDHDGDQDMVIGGEKWVGNGYYPLFIQVYENRGGNYSLRNTYNLEEDLSVQECDWSDIDSDGDDDLILRCYEKIVVLRNDELTATGVTSEAVPAQVYLTAYPNPFNSTIAISYTLASDIPAECAIYNLAGQKVYEFKSMPHTPGMNVLRWDGSDMEGRQVASGLYFVRLRQGKTLVHTKVTYLK